MSVLRVVHVLWAGEGLQRPVDKAVEEDEAGAASPNRQDADEGGTQIIDHLQAPKQTQHHWESISLSVQRLCHKYKSLVCDSSDVM